MSSIEQLDLEQAEEFERLVTDAIAALNETDRSFDDEDRRETALEKLREASRIAPNVFGIDMAIQNLEWDLTDIDGPSVSQLVQKALQLLGEAAKLVPDDPWLWFQIGFLNYDQYFGTNDADAAMEALDQALALDPANIHAQLALAFVLEHSIDAEVTVYVDAAIEELSLLLQDDSHPNREVLSALRTYLETVRDHLRDEDFLPVDRPLRLQLPGTSHQGMADAQHARAQELLAASDWKKHIWNLLVYPTTHKLTPQLVVDYYPSSLCYDSFLDRLEELGKTIDEHQRMEYFSLLSYGMLNATALEHTHELVQRWVDMALEAPEQPESALPVHMLKAQILHGSDDAGAAKHYLRAFALLRDQDHLRSDLDILLAYSSEFLSSWEPDGNEIDLFVQLADAALDAASTDYQPLRESDISAKALADIAEMAARALSSHGRAEKAGQYLAKAKGYAPERSSIWRELADLHLDARRWEDALREYRQVARFEPQDREVHLQIALLESALTGVQDRQKLDDILSSVLELRSGQELILEEISLQRNLLQRAEQAQRQAATAFQRRPDDEKAVDDLVNQLHTLLQEASKIQPVAWRAAEERASNDLGSEVYASLLPDTRHFLLTAEVFYHAGQHVAPHVDAALISVEYAKAVETELRRRILDELGRRLDERTYRGRLDGNGELRRDGKTTWQSTLSNLMLRDSQQLLARAAAGSDNAVVLEEVRSAGFDENWLKALAADLETVRTHYRNGAAHTERLKWGDLEAFRRLLYRDQLLARLIDLGCSLEKS